MVQSMLRKSSVDEDAALLAQLEGRGGGAGTGAGGEEAGAGWEEAGAGAGGEEAGAGAGAAGNKANLLMCVRYRLERKRLLASAIGFLEDEVWRNITARELERKPD